MRHEVLVLFQHGMRHEVLVPFQHGMRLSIGSIPAWNGGIICGSDVFQYGKEWPIISGLISY